MTTNETFCSRVAHFGLRRGAAFTALFVLAALVQTTAEAATITVTSPTDNGLGDTVGTLSYAIVNANDGDVIDIQTNVTISASLPEINNSVTIQSTGGPFTIDGNGNQIFTVSTGTSTIKDLVLTGGVSQGGAGESRTDGGGGGGGGLGSGGALYIGTNVPNGTNVTLENVIFQNNQAVGGAGGNSTGSAGGGTVGGSGGGYNDNSNSATAGTGGATGAAGDGADGGYGGGGAGAGAGGTGNGGGNGGALGVGGGGGGALGGAVFVANGSTLTIKGTTGIASNNTVVGGTAGTGTSGNGTTGFANGGGLYVGIGSTANLDTTLGNLTITGDTYSNGNVVLNDATGTVTFTGNTEVTSNGALTVTTGTVNFNGPGTIISGTLSGAGSLNFNGTGTSVINGSTSNFTGTSTINTGTLQVNTSGVSGNIVNNSVVRFLNANTSGTAFDGGFNGTISGSGDVVIAGNTTLTGIVTFTTANTYTGDTTIDGGRLRGTVQSLDDAMFLNGSTSEILFNQDVGTTTTNTYTGVISGSGRVSLAGSSLIIFSQAQNYTGTTTVNNTGGLQGTTDSVRGTIVNNTVVTFSQAVNGTYGGNMSGTGGLVSNVTGTLTFTGDNTYTGGTTVNSGTLQGDTGAIQGNVVMNNNTVLAFSETGTGGYSGVISGSGSVILNSTGTVVFTGANTYLGPTTILAGATLQGNSTSLHGTIANQGDLVFNQTTTGSFGGAITGAGVVTKTGAGNLIFTGAQVYTGTTSVAQGRLSVNNTLASDVFVGSGGVLGGTGAITGDVFVAAGGTLAPGNSIGTITVNDYTGTGSSVLEVEVNNAGTVPGVNNDYLIVNGNLDPGGATVSVVTNTSVGFTSGTQYTIVSYTNTGTRLSSFGAATINVPTLTPSITYDDTNFFVYLTLLRSSTTFASIAQTPNQAAVANYIDDNSAAASGDFATVVDQLSLLSPADQLSALDQMSGPIYGTAARVNIQNTTYMMMQVERNSGYEGDFGSPRDIYGNPVVDNGSDADTDVFLVGRVGDDGLPVYHVRERQRYAWNAWSTGYGAAEGSDDDITDFATAGNITSLYRYLNDFVKIGAFGAYNYVHIETGSPLQSHRTNDGQLGSYLRIDDGQHHFFAASSMGLDSHHSARVISFGTINRTAQADYDGWQSTGYWEVGRKLYSYPLDFEPFFGMQYTYLRQDGFQETGADSLNLNASGTSSDTLWQLLGARIRNDWLDGVFEMRAVWLYNYLGPTTVLNSTFAPVGGAAFASGGADFTRNNGVFGFGLTWNLTERLNVAGNYDAYVTNDPIFHIGSGTIQYRW